MAYRALAQELSPLKARCKAGLLFLPRFGSDESACPDTGAIPVATMAGLGSERVAKSHSAAV